MNKNCVRCDFHVHSKYSSKPTNWFAKKFGSKESFTEPKHIYETAIKRGMTHVTITDHNNIKGAQKLMELGYDNTFISCEVTTYFTDGCKAHVLVYDINDEEFKEIMSYRRNIYDLVIYLREVGVWHAIAHPLYSINNKLTQDHFEQFFVLFDLIELNGFRSKDTNDIIRSVVGNLTDETLAKLADKHNIENPLLKVREKNFIRGSDDHSGVFVARAYTENFAGFDLRVVFEQANHNIAKGSNGTPKDLAYALYSIGYQFMAKKFDMKKYVATDSGIDLLNKVLEPANGLNTDGTALIYNLIKKFKGMENKPIEGDAKKYLIRFLSSMEKIGSVDSENVSEKWFNIVSQATDATIKDMLNYLIKQLGSRDIFNIFRTFGNLSALYMLMMPYYISFFVFQQTRNFSLSLNIENKFVSSNENKNIAHFTDTFYEVNGVVRTLRHTQLLANKYNYDYQFITCYNKESEVGEKVFKPTEEYDLPGYSEMSFNIPPLLDMLSYCYDKNFSHIHVATPGPIGLAGLLISKILQKPLYGTYHTKLPQYVNILTGEEILVEPTWQYMRWFYNQCEKVFVPSDALIEELKEHGVVESKLIKMPKGVDTKRFQPVDKTEDDKFYLIYVGRISKEKNLDILAEAFKKLDKPNVELILVGDGPYRKEMESKLKGFSATFTGYLHGDALFQAYQNSDIFVFPSTNDTFGNVVLEAHACGIPTIVTDEGGPAENVLEGENGIIVKGEDVYALKEGILKILDKDKIKEMGKKARQSVEERTLDKAFLEWMSYY